jgi:hypothetical protein
MYKIAGEHGGISSPKEVFSSHFYISYSGYPDQLGTLTGIVTQAGFYSGISPGYAGYPGNRYPLPITDATSQ